MFFTTVGFAQETGTVSAGGATQTAPVKKHKAKKSKSHPKKQHKQKKQKKQAD
jgi:hypothetical protein